MQYAQPASQSIAGEISPVKAPFFSGYTFCAPRDIPAASATGFAAESAVKGGKISISA